MKDYELTILTKNKSLRKIKKLLGNEVQVQYDGRKRLAYPINGLEYAHYYFAQPRLFDQQVVELNDKLYRSGWAVRHLLVTKFVKEES